MDMYKKIAHIENEADFNDVITELNDRFGPAPQCVKNLLSTAILKSYAQNAGIKKVEQSAAEVRLFPDTPNVQAFIKLSSFDRENVKISGGKTSAPYIVVKIKPNEDFALYPIKVLKKYKEYIDEQNK